MKLPAKKNRYAKQSVQKTIDIQTLFAKNLKFISQTEIDTTIIERQFANTQTRSYLTIGQIDCPTGHIIVSDPLYYLVTGKLCPQLALSIPVGTYPIEVAICNHPHVGIRMCTARLNIKESKALRYVRAQPTKESAAAKCSDGILSGFPVETGTMSFCDVQVAKEYRAFLVKWGETHHNKQYYNDYFAHFFTESEKALPAYQRKGGDFIEWTNPDSGHRLVMIASGFGDGFYQCHWGYDAEGDVCELIVPMINPDLFA